MGRDPRAVVCADCPHGRLVRIRGGRPIWRWPNRWSLRLKPALTLADLGFTLTAKADRIDVAADGRAYIYDYKTGLPPSPSEQRYFDKQLLLEAAMAENGDFEGLGPAFGG